FWRLGDEWAAKKPPGPSSQSTNQPEPLKPPAKPAAHAGPIHLLSQPGNLNVPPAPSTNAATPSRLANRVSNTTKPLKVLLRSDKAILLRNALIDTAHPAALAIPDHLRAHTGSGSYIVQSRTALDDEFRALLSQAGAQIVSYIPNNAYLVLASAGVARR